MCPIMIGNVTCIGESKMYRVYLVFLWLAEWVNAAPWHALMIAGILSTYYALVRLTLGRMYARVFDISSIVTIFLWIGLWPYELHMQAWEKTVVAPIRLDLFLVAIILNIATMTCLFSSLWSLVRKVKMTYWDRA